MNTIDKNSSLVYNVAMPEAQPSRALGSFLERAARARRPLVTPEQRSKWVNNFTSTIDKLLNAKGNQVSPGYYIGTPAGDFYPNERHWVVAASAEIHGHRHGIVIIGKKPRYMADRTMHDVSVLTAPLEDPTKVQLLYQVKNGRIISGQGETEIGLQEMGLASSIVAMVDKSLPERQKDQSITIDEGNYRELIRAAFNKAVEEDLRTSVRRLDSLVALIR